MSTEIQIFPKLKEESFPMIKLTKSINGKTGTATFLFVNPNCFQSLLIEKKPIEKVILIEGDRKIESKDITLFFKNGKPFLLKTIFLLKNTKDWFDFLNFMNKYSKEKGFSFQGDSFPPN